MAAVEFVVLSAVIGLVIFGSAIAFGFQSSTGLTFLGFSAGRQSYDALPVGDRGLRRASIQEGNPGPLPESTGGIAVKGGYVSSGSPWSGVDRMLDKGPVDTHDPAVKAETPVSMAALTGSRAGPARATGTGYGGLPSGAAASGFSVPLGQAPAGKRPGGQRLAFESPKSAAKTASHSAEVLLDYPIPPAVPDSRFEVAEDPLLVAALAVAHGAKRAEDAPIGMVYAAFTGESAIEPPSNAAVTGLWAGAAVDSLDLSDDDLMLLTMVAGLIAVAAFLWLGSVWLTDRAAIRRRKQWEREKAEALALLAEDRIGVAPERAAA